MLVRPLKTSKLLPVYDPRPYIVTSRKGGEVTATRERPRHTITRNVSFFKKFDAHQGGILKKGSEADADEEELLFEEEAGSESSEGEEEEDLTDVQDSESDDMSADESEESEMETGQVPQQRDHPRRDRNPPPYLSDYQVDKSGTS